MKELKSALSAAVKNVFGVDIEPELTRPDEKFGDYTTNVAMQLGKKLEKNPREIAIAVAGKLHGQPGISEVNIAGPGFINFKLSDEVLLKAAEKAPDIPTPLKGQEILVEFGDPNPFKEMHIGHLYSYIVGDSISKLLEASGASVHRLSYHGDIGLHVAKTIWAMQEEEVVPSKMGTSLIHHIGKYYQRGAKAYEDSPEVKSEIELINESIYKKDDPKINEIYEWAKDESFKEFDTVLSDLKIKTDRRYLESESARTGLEHVKAHLGKVFQKSDGAVVYEGEKAGLHTRVFVTSKGLPTYETKDLGLAELKNRDYPETARSIIITANEQSEYFKVMLAALSEFDRTLADKTTHIPHGFVTLSSGKMSSRKGEVYTAIKLMIDVKKEAEKISSSENIQVEMGAIKYGFLKHRLGSDVIYDPEQSVSLEGNSGPYLQYAHARACSILDKKSTSPDKEAPGLEPAERSLARKISEYPEVVQRATEEFAPSHVASYLYELAQNFNRFYEQSRVIGDERESLRLKLVESYASTLKNGLELLGIEAPKHL